MLSSLSSSLSVFVFSINRAGSSPSRLLWQEKAAHSHFTAPAQDKVSYSVPPPCNKGTDGEKQKEQCDWRRKVESVIKAALGSVTLTAGCGERFPARPDGRRHINLLQPEGAEIRRNLFYFYVLSLNENQIKTKPGASLSSSLFVFLPPPSFLSPHRSLRRFEVQIRSYWCMKVKCRLYTRDHLTVREHAGCNHV